MAIRCIIREVYARADLSADFDFLPDTRRFQTRKYRHGVLDWNKKQCVIHTLHASAACQCRYFRGACLVCGARVTAWVVSSLELRPQTATVWTQPIYGINGIWYQGYQDKGRGNAETELWGEEPDREFILLDTRALPGYIYQRGVWTASTRAGKVCVAKYTTRCPCQLYTLRCITCHSLATGKWFDMTDMPPVRERADAANQTE